MTDVMRAARGPAVGHRATILVALGAMAASVASVAGLIDGVRERADLSSLDVPTLSWLVTHRQPWATTALTGVTELGGELVLVVVSALALLVLLWRRRLVEALLLSVALGTAETASLLLKHLVARARPPAADVLGPVEHTLSFPSGHTLGAAALSLGLAYLWWRSRRTVPRAVVGLVAASTASLVMATSRLYLADHWLTDVLGSMAIAVGVMAAVVLLDLRLQRGESAPPAPQPALAAS